jgi:hypothetical protein
MSPLVVYIAGLICEESLLSRGWRAVQKGQQMIQIALLQGRPAQAKFLRLRVHARAMGPKGQGEAHRGEKPLPVPQVGAHLTSACVRSVTSTAIALAEQVLPDQVFAGQAVGIKEVHDDIWLVSFMDYDLGYFDLETRVLEPLENPFGPKVLPMS